MKTVFMHFISGALRLIWFSALLVVLGSLGTLPPAYAATTGVPQAGTTGFVYQFTSGGHILGFQSDGLYVASEIHALRIQFLDTHNVSPKAQQAAPANGKANPLDKVTWSELWDGISVSYQATESGIVESVYTVEPGAPVDQIHWRYNVPALLNADGSLSLTFANGQMNESAPKAWQEIDGQNISVPVAFQVRALSAENGNNSSEMSFAVGEYDPTYPLTIDPTLTWVSFFGTSSDTTGYSIALDGNGFVYVTGWSNTNWGTPVLPYSNHGLDTFVAEINPTTGNLVWNTFLGGSGNDKGLAIFVATGGWVYIAGTSTATWGSPHNAKGLGDDAFVAKLDAFSGNLTWNTFLGGNANDWATSVAVDASGYIYVGGQSSGTWGTPVLAFGGGPWDSFVAKLSVPGTSVLWSTFLGGLGDDSSTRIVADNGNGVVYAIGTSSETWGSPLRSFMGGRDVFVVKLNMMNGTLTWNAFEGGSGIDLSGGIDVDASGYLYVTGTSYSTWGAPLHAFQGAPDAFVIKLSSGAGWQWMTFIGGAGRDYAMSIRVDSGGNSYIAGESNGTWGAPIIPFSGDMDGFAAKLNSTGMTLLYGTFVGGSGWDSINGITVNASGNPFVIGSSNWAWGSPKNDFEQGQDAFVAKLTTNFLVTWNTFAGGSGEDYATGIAVGYNGHIYISGYSYNAWGTSPRRDYAGGSDAFVAELGPDGSLIHSTFLGGVGDDTAVGVTTYGVFGAIYVVGQSTATWGTPKRAYSGATDTFLAGLDSGLVLQWITFLGGSGYDSAGDDQISGYGILVTGSSSSSTWGTAPVRAYSGEMDAYVALVNFAGDLTWYTYLGGAYNDYGRGIVMDSSASAVVVGYSTSAWGSPTYPYQAGADAFVARLSPGTGAISWSTFIGGPGNDYGNGIAYDESSLYVVGYSNMNWGAPIRPFVTGIEIMVSKLNQSNGVRIWNTFLGGTGDDYGTAINVGPTGDIYVTGFSNASWGSPIFPFITDEDAVVAKLYPNGALQWHGFLGGYGKDIVQGIVADRHYLYLTGRSERNWPVWDGRTQYDVFVTKVSMNDLWLPLIRR